MKQYTIPVNEAAEISEILVGEGTLCHFTFKRRVGNGALFREKDEYFVCYEQANREHPTRVGRGIDSIEPDNTHSRSEYLIKDINGDEHKVKIVAASKTELILEYLGVTTASN